MADFSAWSHYKPITVDDVNVDASLTNFPLLVKRTADADLAAAKANGYDIRFTLDDGTTELDYERISWSGGNGSPATGIWRVKVPSISSSGGASLRMYYGNAAAGDVADAASVYANAEAVLRLNDLAAPFADSTGNGHTASIGQGTNRVAGVIDAGRETTAQGDRLLIADSSAMEYLTHVTVDCWVRFDALAAYTYGYPRVWAKKDYGTGTDDYGVEVDSANSRLRFACAGSTVSSAVSSIAVDTWYHVVARYEWNQPADGIQLYINGVGTSDGTALQRTPSNVYAYSLLARYWNSRSIDGRMEDWRFWKTHEPCGDVASYAKFTHANVTAADNEVTIGAEVKNAKAWFFRNMILGSAV